MAVNFQNNFKTLYFRSSILTADNNGNLNSINPFNLIGRIFHWVKNIINGGAEDKKVYAAVLKTFEEMKRLNSQKEWTFHWEDSFGKDFDIGFDKIAVEILSNSFFVCSSVDKNHEVRNKILSVATEVLSYSLQHRLNQTDKSWGRDHKD